MLIQLTTGNFLSFKNKATLSLVASRITEHQDNLFFCDEETSLLKCSVIYGANASGKSNLIKSFRFMRNFVLYSSKDTQVTEAIPVQNFKLNTESEKQPSFFEIVFVFEGTRYRYGFEASKQEIKNEWLHYFPKKKEEPLFVRDGQNYEVASAFEDKNQEIAKRTRINALYLSGRAQWNGTIATKILSWFKNVRVISGLNDEQYKSFTINQTKKDDGKSEILNLMKAADIPIKDIDVQESKMDYPKDMPSEIRVFMESKGGIKNVIINTVHQKYDSHNNPVSLEKFNMDFEESAGTQKFYAISGPILDSLKNGHILIIDELDSRLHPILTQFLIQLFNSSEYNKKNAQLIFASHDANSLNKDIFRRDQIWFTEKDKFGSSDLYSLVEYKIDEHKVRKDASYSKDYILGKYGAIPFIGKVKI